MDSPNPQHSNSSNSTSSSSSYYYSDSDSDSGSPPSFGSWHHRHHHPDSLSPPDTPSPRSRYDPGSSSRPGPESGSSPDPAPPPGFERFPVENNPLADPQPPHDAGDSGRKRKTRENEIDTDTCYHSNSSRKRKTRENEMDTDTRNDSTPPRKPDGAERRRKNISNIMKTATPGRKQEINLLNDMILFRNKYGRNPYNSRYDMRQFYKYWTKRRAMFADANILNDKMIDLHERFVMNYQTTLAGDDIEYWMDPSEVRVYRLSYRIWGNKDDDQDYSSERTISDESVDSERTISDHSSSTD